MTRLKSICIAVPVVAVTIWSSRTVAGAEQQSVATSPATQPNEVVEGAAKVTTRKVDRTPTSVTLHLADASVTEMFEALGKQADATFVEATHGPRPSGGGFPALAGEKFDVEAQPFWIALRDLCKQTDLRPSSDGSSDSAKARPGAIVLSGIAPNMGPFREPMCLSGPALFVAQRITRTSRLALAEPVREESRTTLDLMAYVEPKLRLAGQVPRVRLDEAVDENGLSLVPAADEGEERRFNPRAGTSWTFRVPIDLRQPPGSGKRIARLRGAAVFTGPDAIQVIEIPGVRESKGARVTIAGQPVDISPLAVEARGYMLHVQMTRKDADDARWKAMQEEFDQRLKEIQLLDEHGRSLPFTGVGPGSSGKKNSEMTIHFAGASREKPSGAAPAGEPATLVWEVPQELSEVVIPFEFSDLQLP